MISFSQLCLALGVFLPYSLVRADTFDYVVVGGGTAGITLAVRLAEASHKVALVEAGTYYGSSWALAAIPGADVIPVGSDPNTKSGADWGINTTPQPGANGRTIHFARGKCLGGSSALNFMIYQRPTKQSMDLWASTVNDTSYTFDNVLPLYKKSVQFTPPNETSRAANTTIKYSADSFDSTGGPLQVSYSNYGMPFSTWMKLGMQAIGLAETTDFNSGELSGYQFCASTIRPKDQARSSSQTSFLDSITSSNLKVYSQHLAKRILFDGQKNAAGVEVSDGLGIKFNITASREVVVSAGAFQSPQLLMVSGIGPSSHLNDHGIAVVSDSPGVGQNMWDHPFVGPSYRVKMDTYTRMANDLIYLGANFLKYAGSQSGPLTNPISDFLGWEKIPSSERSGFSTATQASLAKFPNDWPEAEYISGAGYMGNFAGLLTNQPKDGFQYASMLGVLITPTSRGNVTLASADTSDLPVVNPNWLATKSDQQLSVAIFKRVRQAFASDAMAPLIIGEEYYPGPQVQSDTEILEYIRNNIMTLWHPACTCKMGTEDDPNAVIDSKARVFGVNRLRVVDASSFPFLPPGHPQSSVYMLAEKIAVDMLQG